MGKIAFLGFPFSFLIHFKSLLYMGTVYGILFVNDTPSKAGSARWESERVRILLEELFLVPPRNCKNAEFAMGGDNKETNSVKGA